MIQSRTVAESVISELGLDLTPEELIAKISVDTSGDSTRVLTITVTDEDPYTARDIADTVREMAAEQIKNVMNIEAVNVVDKANVPDQPYSPSVKKNGVLGGLLGILISAAIIVLMHLMNDTIKTAEDVEKYLGMSTLGTIPLTKGTADSKPKKRRKAADVKTAKRSKKS
jgi:capsular polysaccharide biosynthesis protein